MSTLKEAKSTMVKNGAKVIGEVLVKNLKVTEQDGKVYVSAKIDKEVETFVKDRETGVRERKTADRINLWFGDFITLMEDNDDLAYVVNAVKESPVSLEAIFSRSKIELLAVEVPAGTVYTNLITGHTCPEPTDEDNIYFPVTNIASITDRGLAYADKTFDGYIARHSI